VAELRAGQRWLGCRCDVPLSGETRLLKLDRFEYANRLSSVR
jgi:hypothetical protein